MFHSGPTGILIRASNCLADLYGCGSSFTRYFCANFLSRSSFALIYTPFSFESARLAFNSSIFLRLIASALALRASNLELSTPSPAHSFHPCLISGPFTFEPRFSSISLYFSFSKSSIASYSWVTKSDLSIYSSLALLELSLIRVACFVL